MDFVSDNKVDPATTDPEMSNASDLESRYRELALRAAIWPGDPRANNPQLYFEKLPPELPDQFPLPENSRLLGSLVRSAQHIDIYLDSTLTDEQLIEFYTQKLTGTGWKKMDQSPFPDHYRGFAPGNFGRVNNTIFCQGNRGPSLSLQIFPGTGIGNGSPRDVRLNLNLDANNNPCDQARQQRSISMPSEKLIPILSAPPNNSQQLSGGSGGGSDGWYSSATLETDLELAVVAVHYNAQLEKGGWILTSQGQSGPIAWSQWKLKNKEHEQWQGFLFIFKNSENERSHLLYVKTERNQAGPNNFERSISQLRF